GNYYKKNFEELFFLFFLQHLAVVAISQTCFYCMCETLGAFICIHLRELFKILSGEVDCPFLFVLFTINTFRSYNIKISTFLSFFTFQISSIPLTTVTLPLVKYNSFFIKYFNSHINHISTLKSKYIRYSVTVRGKQSWNRGYG